MNSLIIVESDNDKFFIEKLSDELGLKNIELRYSFYTDEKVIVINNEKVFKVILPLIQKK